MKYTEEGTYTLTYTATDECGNTTTQTRTIVVTPADEAYAVLDTATGELTFFRDEVGKYTERQREGTKIYYTGIETINPVNQTSWGWYTDRADVTSVSFSERVRPISPAFMFSNCTNLVDVDLTKLDTSKATSLRNMFYSCSSLVSVDMSVLDTRNNESLQAMFYGCKKLVDIAFGDTSKVKSYQGTFNGCSAFTTFDGSIIDVSSATTLKSMFTYCTALTSIDLSTFDTQNVTDMNNMFSWNRELVTIYASDKFVTDNVVDSLAMFLDNRKLVGGAGTAYTSDYQDKTYARIDSLPDNPGYFTAKE